MSRRLLLVEDSPIFAQAVQDFVLKLSPIPWETEHVTTFEGARKALQREPVDLLILDLGLPDIQGLFTLKSLLSIIPDVQIIVLTYNEDVKAEDAFIQGAIGFQSKESMLLNPQSFVDLLEKCWEKRELERAVLHPETKEDNQHADG